MNSQELIESFSEFKEFKNIDRETMMSILEDVFLNILKKKYGEEGSYNVIINLDKGDLELWRNRTIVDDEFAEDSFDYDENRHISLTEARKIEPDFEIGEEVSEEVKLPDFTRRAVLAMRQN